MTDNNRLFKKAKTLMPGGVNSPVRSFSSLGRAPFYVQSAKGACLLTKENKLIDFCNSWGALILGHSHEKVISSIQKALKNGLSYGLNHEKEVELAQTISNAIPSIDMIRFVNSGTEAVMTAIRLARGYTKRDKIVKFDGCYHGHSDSLLVNAGSGLLTFGNPSSTGVPKSTSKETIICPFNDINAFETIMSRFGEEIAAVITEPIPANMGVIPPKPGFIKKIHDLTRKYKNILIFDEVITGFRFGYGGYQNIIKVKPDLTCLGKIIGGGMPLAAIGGNRKIMQMLSPEGEVYQAGTLSGNPIAVTAGLETLNILKNEDIYDRLNRKAEWFTNELNGFSKKNIPLQIQGTGSMFTLFCKQGDLKNLNDVKQCQVDLFAKLHHYLMKNGIFLSPSQFEACFLSDSHTDKHLKYFVKIIEDFKF